MRLSGHRHRCTRWFPLKAHCVLTWTSIYCRFMCHQLGHQDLPAVGNKRGQVPCRATKQMADTQSFQRRSMSRRSSGVHRVLEREPSRKYLHLHLHLQDRDKLLKSCPRTLEHDPHTPSRPTSCACSSSFHTSDASFPVGHTIASTK